MQASEGRRAAAAVGMCLGASAVAISALPSPWLQLVLVGIVCPFVVLIIGIGNARRLLLGAALLDIPLQLDVHPGYRVDLAELGGLGGFDLSVTTLALGGLYGLWTIELLGRVGPRARPDWRASLPAGAYLACVGLSMLLARDTMAASFQLALLAQMFLLYVYVASTTRTHEDVVFVVSLLLAGLFAEALLMIGMRLTGQSLSIPGIAEPGIADRVPIGAVAEGQASRFGGTIGSANAAAIYLSLLLAPAAAVLLTPLGPWLKRLALVALALGTGALFVTLSRGGWIALAISVAIVLLFANRRGWLAPSVPVALLAVVLVVALVFPEAIMARLMGSDQGSAHSRIPLMGLALRIIEDHPLLGVGANNYVLEMQRYVTPDFSDYGGEWLYLVHNHYLLVWAETGMVGVLALLWFLLATLWAGWRGWQRNDRLLAPLALGFTAAIVGHLFYMSVDLFNDRAQTQTLWVSAALLASLSRVAVRSSPVAFRARRTAAADSSQWGLRRREGLRPLMRP
jgi:putative inorganic carbon (HCO3(-)) transporter